MSVIFFTNPCHAFIIEIQFNKYICIAIYRILMSESNITPVVGEEYFSLKIQFKILRYLY